jgi:hypothetical protein
MAVDLVMALFLAGLATAEQTSVGRARGLLAKSRVRPMQGRVDLVALN